MGDGQLMSIFLCAGYSIISQGKHLHSSVFLNYIHVHTSCNEGIIIQRIKTTGATEKQLHVNLKWATIFPKQTTIA